MAEQSQLERRIGEQIAALQARYYGGGPARVFTQATDRVVIVVLEETFSIAEQTLIARNESEGIQDIRRRFQRIQEEEFRSIVEQATGHQVRSFVSDTDLEQNISIEVFILAGVMEDMSSFERSADREQAEGH
jgi:uncharacterized protein YbcI